MSIFLFCYLFFLDHFPEQSIAPDCIEGPAIVDKSKYSALHGFLLEPVADGLAKAEKLVFSASSTEPGLLVIEEPVGFQMEPDTCANNSFHRSTDH